MSLIHILIHIVVHYHSLYSAPDMVDSTDRTNSPSGYTNRTCYHVHSVSRLYQIV